MILPEKTGDSVMLEENPSRGSVPWAQILPIGEHMAKYMELLEQHHIKFYKLNLNRQEDIQCFVEKFNNDGFYINVAATYGECKEPILFAVDENLGAIVAAIGGNDVKRIYKPIVYEIYRFYHLATVLLNLVLYEEDYKYYEVREFRSENLRPLIDGAQLHMHCKQACQYDYDKKYRLWSYILEKGIGWTDC